MARKLSNVLWLIAAACTVFGYMAYEHNGGDLAIGFVFGWLYAVPAALLAYVLAPSKGAR
jgi:hypothetical protein